MTAFVVLLRMLVVAFALTLAGCGDRDEGDTAPSAVRTAADGTRFNDADVAFASEMVPHHAEALAMVDLTVGRDLPRPVQSLAAAIRESQAPEVEQLADWLTSWGEPVPETTLDHANAHDHGGHSAERLQELSSATDDDFTRLFLVEMIEHHEGAVDMAKVEQEDGVHEGARALAARIEQTQTAEIARMRELLAD